MKHKILVSCIPVLAQRVRGGAHVADIRPRMHAHIRTCEDCHAAYTAETSRLEEQ